MAAHDLIDYKYMVDNYGYTTDEVKVNQIISAVSYQAINITDNDFKAAAYTEFFDGDGRNYFLLKNRPVNSVTSLWISSTRTYDDDSLIDTDNYRYDSMTGMIKLYENYLPIGFDVAKIIYNAGYTEVPEDVEQAVGDAVDWNYKQRNNQATGIESQTFPEGITTVFQVSFPVESLRILMHYRLESV